MAAVPVGKSYPFSSSKTVVSVSGTPNLAFMGAGGGVVILNLTDTANPVVYNPGGTGELRLRTKGFVYRARSLGNYIYAAAGVAGLVRFDRTQTGWPPDVQLDTVADARALAVVSAGTETRVLVGTNALDVAGSLYMVNLANPQSPVVVGPFLFDGPVHALDAWYDSANSRIVALVGTACDGLQRLHIASPYTALPSSAAATWGTAATGRTPKFIRDIKIDSTNLRAYVAAFHEGVFAFNLASDGLALFSGWPIQPTAGNPPVVLRSFAHALALDASRSRLVVALGSWFAGEKQYSAACDRPVPCNSTPGSSGDRGEELWGLKVYSLQDLTNPAEEIALDNFTDPSVNGAPFIPCTDIALRPVDDNNYYIDVAVDIEGYVLVGGNKPPSLPWKLEKLGDYNKRDGLTLHSYDDVLILDEPSLGKRTCYATTELGLVCFDLLATQVLDNYAKYITSPPDTPAAVTLSGFPSPNARLYTVDNGVRIWNIDDKLNPVMSTTWITNPGDIPPQFSSSQHLVAFLGLSLPAPLSNRWIAVSYFRDIEASTLQGAFTGGVRIYHVGTATEANDTQVKQLAKYLHVNVPPARFVGIAARQVTTSELALYVAYSPAAGGTGEQLAGLLTLKVTLSPSGRRVLIEKKSQVPAFMVADLNNATAGKVTYDEGLQRVYVGLNCNGVAVYDVSSGKEYTPALKGHLKITTAFHAIRGPQSGSTHKLYVSLSSNGIVVIDDLDNVNTATKTTYQTPFQSFSMALDPDDTTKKKLFVCHGRGGIHRLDFP